MATPQAVLSEQFSNQTSLASIQNTMREMRYQPEDLRTRRFGYNPGWQNMVMDAKMSGLQTGRVEPGKLTLFESFPMMRQNWSVDASDPGPKALGTELLAGDQVANLLSWYKDHGFREVLPLRGAEDDQAKKVFGATHPPLIAGFEEVIPTCPFHSEHNPRVVCVSCREKFLDALVVPRNGEGEVRDVLKESVTASKIHMTNMWNSWVTELSARHNNAAGDKGALGVLRQGHLYIMEHLHQRTPTDAELAKVTAANAGLQAAMREQTEMLTQAMGLGQNDRVIELERQNAELNTKFQQLMEQFQKTLEQKEPVEPQKPKAKK